MTRGKKQELFTRLMNKLEAWILKQDGYEIRSGETHRHDVMCWVNSMPKGTSLQAIIPKRIRYHGEVRITPPHERKKIYKSTVGHGRGRNSVHNLKLAKDLLLFKDGKYLTKTEDYAFAGLYWISLHPLCRWGGAFSDGNHFSLEHNGRM
jgi:hypothetical protein